MSDDPLRNPKDPLRKSGPEGEQELFRLLAQQANGFVAEQVVGAAANMIVNALRQQHANRADAERIFDELMARTKTVLLDNHYNSSGQRLNVFPFHQIIQMKTADFRKKLQ